MSPFYSLLALIELCAWTLAEDKGQEQSWTRKGYVWRKLRKVLPDGAPHTRGSGASKRYAASAIPIVAVLLYISNRFAAVEVLDAISQAIQHNLVGNPDFSLCWAAAIANAEGETSKVFEHRSYLTIGFPNVVHNGFIVRCGARPQISGDDTDIYCLDLDFVFIQLFRSGCEKFGEGFRLSSTS